MPQVLTVAQTGQYVVCPEEIAPELVSVELALALELKAPVIISNKKILLFDIYVPESVHLTLLHHQELQIFY